MSDTAPRSGRGWVVLGFAAWQCVATAALAGPARLVKDINSASDSNRHSYPYGSAVIGAVTYFTADDGVHGRELWRTDGTPSGTWMVKDIDPGQPSSVPCHLTAVDGTLYFAAGDSTNGYGLWKSDGTADGTVKVKDFAGDSGFCNSLGPGEFTATAGTVFFSADDGEHGAELWKTDGTPDGTALVKDIALPESGFGLHSLPRSLVAFRGELFFVADDRDRASLWRSDGTAGGTVPVRDPAQDEFWFPAQNTTLRVVRQTLLFAANDGIHGTELWGSDGTAVGTRLVKDTVPGPESGLGGFGDARSFVAVGNLVYFFAWTGEPEGPIFEPPPFEVWRSDGTEAGTKPVGRFANGPPPRAFAALGNALFFAWPRYQGPGGLWKASSAGVEQVRVLGEEQFAADTGALVASGQRLFLLALADESACALWTSDGTANGTRLLRNDAGCFGGEGDEDVDWIQPIRGGVLFGAVDPDRGYELFRSDGTTAGTTLVADINDHSRRTLGSDPLTVASQVGVVGDVILFPATDTSGTRRLWRSDGTEQGTLALSDVQVEFGAALRDRFVFSGNDGSGRMLWVSDGSAPGTHVIAPLQADRWIAASPAGDVAFLFAYGPREGAEIWRTDGTADGTFMVRDLTPGPSGTLLGTLLVSADLAFFTVADRTADRELWKSDGTGMGTERLMGFESIGSLAELNGTLYFSVREARKVSLWRSDGTSEGTVRVTALAPPALTSAPVRVQYMTPAVTWASAGALLFFAWNDGATGTELWRTDGTPEGTHVVRDIRPGAWSGLQAGPVSAGGRAYLIADDGEHGAELWRSDGTAEGTSLVRDVDPRRLGPSDVLDPGLSAAGNLVLFRPFDRALGVEPWRSDGTPEGTVPIDDVAPGPLSSLSDTRSPLFQQASRFWPARSQVFFAATDGRTGSELWTVPISALTGPGTCRGDCDADGRVTIDELVRGVSIALSGAPVSECAAADANADGAVSIGELVAAVGAALTGC